MDERDINEQYKHIKSLIEEKRLKEALAQLESFLCQCPEWTLRTRLEQLQTSYSYMLQYMQQGTKDPNRWEMHQKLLSDTWNIADHARLLMLDKASDRYYHSVRRTPRTAELNTYNLKTLMQILESFKDDLAVSELLSDKKIDEALYRHGSTLQFLFLQAWTNTWTEQEEEDAQLMLISEQLPVNDLCLFVSAVTLSLMEYFDYHKIMWLLDAYRHPSAQINQRALVGIVIFFHIHRTRIELYPELINKVSLMDDVSSFGEELAHVYRQVLLCQETEKIDKKMREEIIPEMLKNVSSMRNTKFGFEENDDENDLNPDWKNAFEMPELEDKLREMSELQQEGADVYMSTFATLKGYPFFREVHNWFYPFDQQQSDVFKASKQKPNSHNSIMDLILQTSFFSNSDKYSLFFTLQQLPIEQREMMSNQLSDQQIQELGDKMDKEGLKLLTEHPSTISNQYLHDLYRFFKLNVRKREFRDIFKEKLDLHNIPALDNSLYKEDILLPIADFYLAKGRLEDAIELYEEMEEIGAFQEYGSICYQKLGYAYQKQKNYAKAISAYIKSDTMHPDYIWNNRHLATCYRLNQNYQVALTYYKKVEEVSSNDKNVIFYIASCLAELGQYENALNYFFKLDFTENNSIKAWRGISWCSFVIKKNEQAMKYYEKIIEQKPLAIDWMNAGHVAWVMDNIPKAITFYGKAIAAYENRERFLEIFRKDTETLLKQGIREENIPLMLDLL